MVQKGNWGVLRCEQQLIATPETMRAMAERKEAELGDDS